jgi:hypothetical protein
VPLARLEQLEAPLDRRPQRPLPLRGVARARREQVEAPLEPFEDALGSQHLHARGRQLEGEREPVQPPCDVRHVLIGLEGGQKLPGSLDEQRDGLVDRQGRHGVLLLPRDVQPLAARREDARLELRDH